MSITRAARISLLEVVDNIASLVLLTSPPLESTFLLVDAFIRSNALASNDQRFSQNIIEIVNACRQSDDSEAKLHLQAVALTIVDVSSTPNVSDEERKFLASQYARQIKPEADSKGINGQLTRAERKTALQMLEDLGASPLSVDELIAHADEIIEEFESFYVGFGARFRREILALRKSLVDHTLTKEHERIVRGALVYLLEDQDVVPDELGLIGLMDDMYVVRQAATVIDPELTALSDVAEQVLFDFPFLKDFSLENEAKDTRYRLSDFALNSFRPLASALLDPAKKKRSYLRTGQTGPQAILFGVISSLAVISLRSASSRPQEFLSSLPFAPGDKVLIDQKSVAVFEGIESVADSDMLRLRTDIEHEGGPLGSWQHLPIKELGRLMPCDQERVTRGFSGAYITSKDTALSPLEQLLHQPNQPVLFNTDIRIFCVCLKHDWDAYYKDVELFDSSLGRVFPISRISRDGDIAAVSSSIEPQQAILFVAHDIDSLTELSMDGFIRPSDILIIDGVAQEAKFTSLLEPLLHRPSVVIYGGDLDTVNAKFLAENDFTFFDWPDRLVSESVNANSIDSLRPPAFSWEPKLKRQANLSFDLVQIEDDKFQSYFESFEKFSKSFRKYAREEGVSDLGNTLIQFAVKSMSSNTLCASLDVSKYLSEEASKIADALATNYYVPDDLKALAVDLLQYWSTHGVDLLKTRDDAIEKVLRSLPANDLVKVAPKWLDDDALAEDWISFSDLRRSPKNGKVVLFPYWPSKNSVKKISRAGQSSSFVFLLSDGEARWFNHYRGLGRLPDSVGDRFDEDLVHLISASSTPIETQEPLIEEDDLVTDFKIAAATLQAEALVREAPNKPIATATKILFLEPEAQVFATDRSHFTVVEVDGDDYKIWERTGNKVRVGDFVLFFSSTDRSVIRERADEILPVGTRDQARSWQSAVRHQLKLIGLTTEGLRNRLAEHGLERHVVTIENWVDDDELIAPRKYKIVLPILFEILGIQDVSLDEVVLAISAVYSAHIDAAKSLTKEVREQLSNTGAVSTDLSIYSVESVVSASIEVPYTSLSRPLSS